MSQQSDPVGVGAVPPPPPHDPQQHAATPGAPPPPPPQGAAPPPPPGAGGQPQAGQPQPGQAQYQPGQAQYQQGQSQPYQQAPQQYQQPQAQPQQYPQSQQQGAPQQPQQYPQYPQQGAPQQPQQYPQSQQQGAPQQAQQYPQSQQQGAPQQAQPEAQPQQQQAPGWYADPFGRHEYRWWDGATWTEHVNSQGRAGTDMPGGAAMPAGIRSADKVVQDVQAVGGAAGQGGGTLFTEPVLVVSQKAKLIEVSQEYAVYDQHGRQLGAIRQVGQSAVKKALRVMTSWDSFMSHSFQIVDAHGQVQLQLTRPAKLMKSRLVVQNGAGAEIGQMVQQTLGFGKFRFSLESGGHEWGSLNAENLRAWNFNIQDHTGAEVARITKKYAGLKAAFTTADNYVLQIHRPLEEPLRSLVVGAALGVDQAIHQMAGS